jgi:hypothetical protein
MTTRRVQMFHRRVYSLIEGSPRYYLLHYLDVSRLAAPAPAPSLAPALPSLTHAVAPPSLPVVEDDEYALDFMSDRAPLAEDDPDLLAFDPLAPLHGADDYGWIASPRLFVLDFAPSSCSAAGGEKMLLCLSGSMQTSRQAVQCQFGSARVAAEWISSDVIRCVGTSRRCCRAWCRAAPQCRDDACCRCAVPPIALASPPCTGGDVSLAVVSADGTVMSSTSTFRYIPDVAVSAAATAAAPVPASAASPFISSVSSRRAEAVGVAASVPGPSPFGNSARGGLMGVKDERSERSESSRSAKRAEVPASAAQHSDSDDPLHERRFSRQHKIRIVERLENTLGVELLDDNALATLSDEALEAQTEALLEMLVTQMVHMASEEDVLTSEVCGVSVPPAAFVSCWLCRRCHHRRRRVCCCCCSFWCWTRRASACCTTCACTTITAL